MKIRQGAWTWDGKPVGKRQLHIEMTEDDILGAMLMSLIRANVPNEANVTHVLIEGKLVPDDAKRDRVWSFELEADWYDR